MIDAMEYWVREFDIDGYRCDVAGWVPVDFWNDARKAWIKLNQFSCWLKMKEKATRLGI